MARVLVVDDDEDIRELVALRVRSRGHQVLAAASGDEALAAAQERGAPDVAGREMGATYLTKRFIPSALLAAIDRAVVPTEVDAW